MKKQILPSGHSSSALRRQRSIFQAMACGLLLLLTGCQLPALRGAARTPPVPPDFGGRTSPASSATLGIDEFFDDPVLTQLICQGLASNQELKILNEEVQIAGNEILARKGAYLPFLFFRGAADVEKTSKYTPLGAAEEQLETPGGGEFPDPLPNVEFSLDLFWRIDLWREFRNAKDAAMQRYCKAVEERNYFVTQLVSEIAENYYELAALDKQLEFLNQNIDIQLRSLEVARLQKDAARGTELGVQRFLAEVRKNESQRLIIDQEIIQVQNRINFLVGRYPQPVERVSWDFISLDSRPLSVGVPAQLLQNRRDIRAAERELAAAGLDVLVARAHFYPSLDISAGIGFEAFNPKFLFEPDAFVANLAGDLVAPLVNRRAIQAEYLTANAKQLQALYDYQRTVLKAFTEVVNAMSKVENYRRSVEIRQQQVAALEESVDFAGELFQAPILEEFAKVEYVDVLLSTRELLEARTELIETKQQQLAAIVQAYQALGGGYLLSSSGKSFAELYCPAVEIHPEDVAVPLAPDSLMMDSEAGKATLAPAPGDPVQLPAPGSATPSTFPDQRHRPPTSEEAPPTSLEDASPTAASFSGAARPFPGDDEPQPFSGNAFGVQPLF
jgi:NodT family efflux transporter outer membrane factor (OMF) lipoprotein